MISLIFPNPTPASRIRHQGARHWHEEPYASWLAAARVLAAAQYRGPASDLPIVVGLVVVRDRPAKRPTWAHLDAWKAGWRLWAPTRPDVDNYLKAALDAMNGRVFVDDGQVVATVALKVAAAAGESAKVLIYVGTVEEMDEVFSAARREVTGA